MDRSSLHCFAPRAQAGSRIGLRDGELGAGSDFLGAGAGTLTFYLLLLVLDGRRVRVDEAECCGLEGETDLRLARDARQAHSRLPHSVRLFPSLPLTITRLSH